MAFKKIKEGEDVIFELKGWDIDGRKIEEWRFMKSDFVQVVKILGNKYGMNFFIKEKSVDRDLDWIK